MPIGPRIPFLAAGCETLTARDRRNLRRYEALLLTWAASYVLGAWAVSGELAAGALAWLPAGLSSSLALAAAVAFRRYLYGADELQRRIQLQALALGLGAAFVAWPGLNLLDAAGAAIPRLGDVLPMLVIGFYVAGIIRARRHYR